MEQDSSTSSNDDKIESSSHTLDSGSRKERLWTHYACKGSNVALAAILVLTIITALITASYTYEASVYNWATPLFTSMVLAIALSKLQTLKLVLVYISAALLAVYQSALLILVQSNYEGNIILTQWLPTKMDSPSKIIWLIVVQLVFVVSIYLLMKKHPSFGIGHTHKCKIYKTPITVMIVVIAIFTFTQLVSLLSNSFRGNVVGFIASRISQLWEIWGL